MAVTEDVLKAYVAQQLQLHEKNIGTLVEGAQGVLQDLDAKTQFLNQTMISAYAENKTRIDALLTRMNAAMSQADGKLEQLKQGIQTYATEQRTEMETIKLGVAQVADLGKVDVQKLVGELQIWAQTFETNLEKKLAEHTAQVSLPTPPPGVLSPDPWAQTASSSLGGAGQQGTSTPSQIPGGAVVAAGSHPRGMRFSVQDRNWGDNKKLDLIVTPEAYLTWRDRAIGHLAKDRPDIRRLLLWAEKQTEVIDTNMEVKGSGVFEKAEEVSYVLFEAIKFIIHDNLLSRARVCGDGRGLELWRKLHSEWEGAAPQVVAAKSKRFQDPSRCSSVLQLWEVLPAWEQLGLEVTAGGYPLPDWLKANSLEKLLPDEMMKTVVGRPELAAYGPKLAWVKAQMDHAKSVSRAAHYGAGKGRLDAGNAMDVSNVNEDCAATKEEEKVADPLMANIQEAVENALLAMTKGKGKGKGGFGGSKGGYKGFNSLNGSLGKDGFKGSYKGAHGKGGGAFWGKGGGKFNGNCNHCGRFGHMKRDCRQLDEEMAKIRGLNNIDGGADENIEESQEATANDDSQQDVWWMGATYSLMIDKARPVSTANRFKLLEENHEENLDANLRVSTSDEHPSGHRRG